MEILDMTSFLNEACLCLIGCVNTAMVQVDEEMLYRIWVELEYCWVMPCYKGSTY
jgi:hypothetical protein